MSSGNADQRAVALARALVLERALRRRGHALGHVGRAGALEGPGAGRRAEIPTQALDLDYQATPLVWPLGIVAGVLVIGVLGLLSCRRAVVVPPLVVLREV